MAHPKTLLVHPNPYAAPLDEKGRPTGVYPFDPLHDPGRGWVGARLVKETVKDAEGAERETGDVIFEFEDGPVELPFILTSNHYRRGIEHGDIIAADIETARRCNISESTFRPPQELIAAAREKALREWKAQHPDEVAAVELSPVATAKPDEAPMGDSPAPATPEQDQPERTVLALDSAFEEAAPEPQPEPVHDADDLKKGTR